MYPKRSVRSMRATSRRGRGEGRGVGGASCSTLVCVFLAPCGGSSNEQGRTVSERTSRCVFLLLTHEEQRAMCTALRYLLMVACSQRKYRTPGVLPALER